MSNDLDLNLDPISTKINKLLKITHTVISMKYVSDLSKIVAPGIIFNCTFM